MALAQRYKKFTTKNQGIRIVAFGFLFDFTGNYNNTVVQPVEDTIKEPWFQEAIRDREVDLFVVAGHVAVRSKEYAAIFKAIRQEQWDTPIQFFGGHTHIRDYMRYDSKSYALESGRYMETVGFMSIEGLVTGGKENSLSASSIASPTFSRRYIDNNLFSFHHHTGLNTTTFPTGHGTNVSALISSARKTLGLDSRFGCAPTDLWTNRAPYPSKNSIFTWLEESVLPNIGHDTKLGDRPRLLIINTGAIRFDIFKGPFTRDSTYSVSPFTSGFRHIKAVPYSLAKGVLPMINRAGPVFEQAAPGLKTWMLVPPEQMGIQHDIIAPQSPPSQASHHSNVANQFPLDPDQAPLTPGYTTTDDAGVDGDDTLHSPISMYRVPNCIEALVGPNTTTDALGTTDDEPETVDLVFLTFIQPWILLALRFLGAEYADADTGVYMEGMDFTTMIARWVEGNWEGSC